MYKKTVYLLALGLILASTGLASAALVGQIGFNGGSVKDLTGKGHDGTIVGNITFGAGRFANCLVDDGTGYVALAPATGTDIQFGGRNCTVAAWIKTTSTEAIMIVTKTNPANNGTHEAQDRLLGVNYTAGRFSADNGWVGSLTGNAVVNDGQWHHVAWTQTQAGAGTTANWTLYVDGKVDATGTQTPQADPASHQIFIGRGLANSFFPNTWVGSIDDVRFYDNALLEAEINAAMVSGDGDAGMASCLYPADRASDVPRDADVSWTAGKFAQTHDVYVGETLADVNSASRTAPGAVLLSKGQTETTFDPGRLEFGKTYYWRVDEVNAPSAGGTIYKGNVWSFTVEPVSVAITGVTATADSSYDTSSVASKTVDGSGLDSTTDTHGTTASDMWISGMTAFPHWIQFSFDKLYKLDQMAVWNSNQMMEGLFGLSAKDVLVQVSTDGTTWTDVGSFVFTKGPGNTTCAADTKVPFNGAAAQYVKLNITSNWGGFFTQGSLSEVRFYAIPVAAREPSPAPGSTNLHPQVAMSWRAGREAASHEVYIGSDANAVAASTTPTATVTAANYDAAVGLGQTYYWKVVEVNQATSPSSWPSDVWSFSTATFINVDDFEGYTNNSPKRVFQTWIDGSGFSPDEFFPNGNSGNGTGALVGYDPQAGDIMEMAYVRGKQSMPLFYDNSTGSKVSEAIRTLDPAKDTTDWSKYSLTTLVLFFHGSADNGAAPVYVKINNTKKVYGVADATTIPYWKQWNIDLASIPAADLKAVKTITIGVGDGSAAGSGKILIDDIRLYAAAPAVAVPTDPGTTGLEALYSMEGDIKDSSGKGLNGTLNGEPSFVDGPAGMGKALAFDGTNDFVDLPIGNLISTLGGSTFAARVNFTGGSGSWQRVFDFGTGTSNYVFLTPRQGANGTPRAAIRTAAIAEQGANGSVGLPTDGWHHMAVVFDDTVTPMRIRLYVDGVQVSSGATQLLPKNMGITTQNWLGRSQWSGDAYLTGSLDDFRIYSRPLSEGEIRYLAGDR